MTPDTRRIMLNQLIQLRNWPEVFTGEAIEIEHKVTLKNPFDESMDVDIIAMGDPQSNWKIAPVRTRVSIAPGKSAELKWQIKSPKVGPPAPAFVWTIKCGRRQMHGEGNIWVH
jgi:hypothetical protein